MRSGVRLGLALLALAGYLGSCGGGGGQSLDQLALARDTVPLALLGIQNEFRAPENPKGDEVSQGTDIRSTLGVRHVRTTFFFDESYLASEASAPSFERFDAILAAIPAGVDLLPILTSAPGWLAGRADWKDVFVARYVVPVVERYGSDPRIAGWEIWNEPNAFCNGQGTPAGVLDCSAADYVDLVARTAPAIRARSSAPVVGAASTSIPQSFPANLDFNRAMVDAGLLPLIDVYTFHWYGEDLEKLALGIASFLESTGKPVWCTESGERGSANQLAYAKTVFAPLAAEIAGLERIYVYAYFDGLGPAETFGLVAADGTESDLYGFLRDR